VFFFERKLRLK